MSGKPIQYTTLEKINSGSIMQWSKFVNNLWTEKGPRETS